MSHTQTKSRPWWQRLPLYLQIVIALPFAAILGLWLSSINANPDLVKHLAIPCDLVLKALRALATPLILLAVVHSFLTTNIPGRAGRRLATLLLTNTLAAICIGLLVANILQPGKWGQIAGPDSTATGVNKTFDPWALLQDMVPEAILKPLVDNNVIQLIFVVIDIGAILRT